MIFSYQSPNSYGASQFKAYDQFGRVTSEVNGADEETAYTYDLQGNLTSITDAKGQKTSFVYDDLGRLQETIDPIIETPSDKTVKYTYDELGNLLTSTDRKGQAIRKQYDTLNRVILVEYVADGTSDTLRYDQYGNLREVANSKVSYTYNYDNRHRLLSKTDSRNGKSLQWSYDAAGNVLTKTDYQGKVTRFVYDSNNRLISMKNPDYLQASYHYDAAGRLLSRILSSGASTIYKYDRDGFLKEITQRSANGSIVDKREFTPDHLGNIEQLVINDTETVDYSYDPAYRLLTADSSDNSHDFSYTYDAVGNRLSKTASGVTHHYLYGNGNRLNEVRVGAIDGALFKRYDYDDNGSRIKAYNSADQLIQQLTYNQGRLVTSLQTESDTLQFAYDPNAYRIEKTTGSKHNNYLLEGEQDADVGSLNILQRAYTK